MDLKSEPQYETVNVTDIDIAFPGDLQTFTLRDGVDRFVMENGRLVITFATSGQLEFYLEHVHYTAIRHRSIRVLVPEAQSGQSAAAPPPSNTE